jgi:DNA-binding transcriptional MerR regulator
MTAKADGAFRTISEVSEMLDVPAHVLRFWESKFKTLSPLKRNGGRRYYRPDDVDLLVRIRDLLYRDGYTIKGAQKLLTSGDEGEGRRHAVGTAESHGQLHEALALLAEAQADIGRIRAGLGA